MRKDHDSRLPSLRSLQVFAAAARYESFTEAAKAIGVTQGAVSRQVHELERNLGRELFGRNGPGVELTPSGRDLASRVDQALTILGDAVALFRARSRPEYVTMSMLPSVAAKWLAPRLGRFIERYPDIDLRVSASRHLVDFVVEEIDCAVRYGAGLWPGVTAHHVADETVFPVCSPAYAQRVRLEAPTSLVNATLLHSDIREDWRAWFEKAGLPDTDVPRGPLLADDAAMLQAAIGGHGVALGRSLLVRDDIDAGRLIAPFATQLISSWSYWFVTPVGVAVSKEVEAVKAWILEENADERR